MNNRVPPSSTGPLSPKNSLENLTPAKNFSARESSFGGWGRFFLLMLLLGAGVGIVYALHQDAGIGAAIIVVYGGLYWAFRKTQGVHQKPRYPIIRYRGHPTRKKGLFL